MPDTKISALPVDSSLSGTEEVPLRDGSANTKATLNSLRDFFQSGVVLASQINGVSGICPLDSNKLVPATNLPMQVQSPVKQVNGATGAQNIDLSFGINDYRTAGDCAFTVTNIAAGMSTVFMVKQPAGGNARMTFTQLGTTLFFEDGIEVNIDPGATRVSFMTISCHDGVNLVVSGAGVSQWDEEELAVGFSTFNRNLLYQGGSNVTPSSGEVLYTHFTAPKSLLCSTITLNIFSARAGGTTTIAKVGICTVGADGAPTLTSAVVSDTTMFDNVGEKALALGTAYQFVVGRRYALAVVGVQGTTWTTAPTLLGSRNMLRTEPAIKLPVLSSRRTAQTDLVGATAAQQVASNSKLYAEFS